jgi:hypothetical protein
MRHYQAILNELNRIMYWWSEISILVNNSSGLYDFRCNRSHAQQQTAMRICRLWRARRLPKPVTQYVTSVIGGYYSWKFNGYGIIDLLQWTAFCDRYVEVAVGYCNSVRPFVCPLVLGCAKTVGDSAFVTVGPAGIATDAFLLLNGERPRLAFNSQIRRPYPSSADGGQWRIQDFYKKRPDNLVEGAGGRGGLTF